MLSPTEQEKQKQPFYTYRQVRFQVIPLSPSAVETPLQISCFFNYAKNQEMRGGTLAVDEHFHGAIRTLRQENIFAGEAFETLLLTPSNAEIPAQRLLFVGLGDPEKLTADIMKTVGRLAVNEAIKLGVTGFCFAPSILDAGVTSLPASDISGPLVKGMAEALAGAEILVERGLIPRPPLREAILLASPQHLENAQMGMRNILEKEKAK